MAFLEGLLGGSDPYELYGDLLTDKQRAALRDQQMGQGLLRMAGAFAEAAKPSLLPTGGIGSALGKAAGALAGHEDEGLKGIATAQKLRQMQQEMAWQQKLSPLMLEYYQRMNGGAAAPAMPPGPSTAGPSVGPNAPPAAPPVATGDFGSAGEYGAGQGPPAAAAPAPDLASLWGIPGDTGGGGGGGGGGPPDQVIRPPGQVVFPPARHSSLGDPYGGLLSPASYGGATNGGLPFRLAAASSPGAAGDILDTVKRYESGGRNIHQGVVSPNVSSAQGYYQITNSTWRDTAPKAGVDLEKYPTAMTAPKEVQRAVAEQLYSERGAQPWAAFNPALAKAIGYAGASSRGERPADIVLPSGDGDGGGGQLQALQALMQMFKSSGDTADEDGGDSLSALAQLTSGGSDTVIPPAGGGGGPRATPASYNGGGAAAVRPGGDPPGGDPWIMQNKVGFPTLTNPDTPPIRMTSELPKVPFGQDPGDFLPGGGTGTPATNLDTVIPSGRGLPASMLQRAQYNPLSGATGAGGGAPAAAPTIPGMSGTIPGTDKTPEQIATLNALMKMYGMKSPLSDLLETYYKSPGYLAGVKAAESTAEYGVKKQFEPGLQADILRATMDPKVQLKEKEAIIERRSEEIKSNRELYNNLQRDFAKDNLTMEAGADGKVKLVPLPGAAQQRAQNAQEIAAATKAGEAPYTFVDATVKLPGESQEREMKLSVEDYNKIKAGQEVTINGVKIPAMSGITLGKQTYSPGQMAAIQAEGTAQAEMYKSGLKALDTAHDAVRAANQRTPYYSNMLAAMQGFQPGATAEARLTGMQYLKDIGIIKGDNVPQGEALKLAAERLAFLALPPGQGSWAIAERQMLKNSIGSISLTPEGLTDAIRMMQQLDDYDRKVSEIHRQVADKNKGLPNLLEAQRQVEALGPPLTAAQQTALERLQQQPATPSAAPGGEGNATKSANEIIQNGWRYDATTHRPIGPVQ
jgi:hypothetical protein